MLLPGQKAPDFHLVDQHKNKVSLESFRGKSLVLFFFPMAWTGTCTREMCTVQDDLSAYSKLNAAVAGVSVDTLYALKRFAEDHRLNFPLLSDFNKVAIRDYDVVHHDFSNGYKDVARRATFIIDRGGILRYAEVLPELGNFPDMKKIKSVLEEMA